eukprot:GFUD01008859.1.p1 GENE.GFUD01008859.1~~GFUD01008859.1.p1  ORF type:complete len:861 (-),score=226.89 GFUD01008859.1:737-3319(-)
MRTTEIELVTYSIEDKKDQNENYYQVATTNFSEETEDGLPATTVDISEQCTGRFIRIDTDDSLLFTTLEDQEELDDHEAGQLLRATSWKPLKSPADKDWIKIKQTEEEEWLDSLKVPKEWLASDTSSVNLLSSPSSPVKSKVNPSKSDQPEKSEGGRSGWFLLSNHRQGLARGVAMTLNRNVSSFTSYIDLEPPSDTKDPVMDTLPDLLPGEMVISQADRVCVYSTHAGGKKKRTRVSGLMRSMHARSYHGREVGGDNGASGSGLNLNTSRSVQPGSVNPNQLSPEENSNFKLKDCFAPTWMTSGQTGALFVTTLKLSFKLHVEKDAPRSNKLLGDTDITLSSIQAVYEILGDTGEKRKKLPLGSNVSNKIDGIFVLCKNFRFLRFSFKFAGVDTGRNITNALLHHSRPKKNELLFAFEHSLNENLHNQYGTVWEDVRRESECPNMRVSRANDTWQVSISLPQQFVVPAHVTDEALSLVSGLCLGTRPPVWVWGNKVGGAVFIQPTLNVSPSPSVDHMFEDFYRTKKRVTIDVDQSFPSHTQLEDSFISVLELHCMDGEKEAEEKDKSYFSSLESTGWLTSVGSALRLASQVADQMTIGKTVVLREGEGRSSSILIASLAQLLVCEDFRTRAGFEGLIQSNWVSLGFQFSKSHTLSNLSSKMSNLNPTFLLFLDCVHQMSLQFPSKLEFLPQYLMDVWDTTLLPVFDTFIFDSEHDRAVARSSPEIPLQLHSAWDWVKQFTSPQIEKWDNPLYGVPLRPPRSSSMEPSDLSMIMERQVHPTFPESKKFLPVSGEIINLSVWYQLFHRSVPFLSTTNTWTEKLTDLRREAKASVTTMMKTTKRPGVNHKNNHNIPHPQETR